MRSDESFRGRGTGCLRRLSPCQSGPTSGGGATAGQGPTDVEAAAIAAAILGRALFYVLVIPTTMPGAFFWRNKGFVDHARETGLAAMPQVGVVMERH